MFNGIVESVGSIENIAAEDGCLKLCILPDAHFDDLKIGDSLSVNGVCLTITETDNHHVSVTVVPETLRKSNLGGLSLHAFVNLERSLKANDRISGHFVQGHVDGVGEIVDITPEGQGALLMSIAIPQTLSKYVVNKGYVALDGMSITVIDVEQNCMRITIIPHTRQSTIAKQYQVGSLMNIEVDMVGKYIENMLRGKYEYAC